MAVAPDDTMHKFKVDAAIAWAAARGIARETHYGVVLLGRYGVAGFGPDGSVEVTWNGDSTTPGERKTYGPNVTACIC